MLGGRKRYRHEHFIDGQMGTLPPAQRQSASGILDAVLGVRRAVLFVIGRGFDPRMSLGLDLVLGVGGEGPRDVIGLDFREGPRSPSLIH